MFLVGELSRLASYVRLYRRLHERRMDRLNEMNIAPAFFLTTYSYRLPIGPQLMNRCTPEY